MVRVPSEFVVDYDDFSGGMFVGPNGSKQPRNTFVGAGMLTVEKDGMLMPCPSWVARAGGGAGTVDKYSGFMRVTDHGDQIFMGGGSLSTTIRGEYTGEVNVDKWDIATAPVTNTWAIGFFVGRWAQYGSVIYVAEGGSALAGTDVNTNAKTTVTTPAAFNDLILFGDVMVGATADKIFWSAPADPTSWPAANFLLIASTSAPIASMCLHGSSLLVLTGNGIYQITGVLGSTETKVQVTADGPAAFLLANGAETASDGSVLFAGRGYDGSGVLALRGSVVEPVAWYPSAQDYRVTAQCGGAVAFYDNDTLGSTGRNLLVRSSSGRWHAMTQAAMDLIGGAGSDMRAWAIGPSTHRYLYGMIGTSSTATLSRFRLGVEDPPMNAAQTAFNSATVALAEYMRNNRFRIREVVAEVSLGTTALNATRSVGVQMMTPQTPLEGSATATAFSAAGSTLQTITLPALASTADERVTLRFNPTDGTETFSMIPKVTLQGVKLRRLLVHCVDSTN